MRENEYKFYGRFRDRCKSILCIRVENALGSGFPDSVLLYEGETIMAEFKAEYTGGHIYMRNTQMSFCTQFFSRRVDIPVITGTLDGGLWVTPFSSFTLMPSMDYKGTYKRFNSKDLVDVDGKFIPQRCNWDEIVVPILYPQ